MTADAADSRDIARTLAHFAQVVADHPTTEAVLQRLGEYCTQLLPVHGVGVLLRDARGGMEVATANTEAGKIVETLEAELREGPCTDALARGEQILAPDLGTMAEQYPAFVPRAMEAGVRSIHALPLTIRAESIGAMDLIALEPLDLNAEQLATAQMLGDVTISYIANSRLFQEKTVLAQQLQQALDSRVVIEQAKGVISERRRIPVSEAFETIRSYARRNQRKLREVADEIVRGELDV